LFLLIPWIRAVIAVLADVFRSRDFCGLPAAFLFFIILIPYLVAPACIIPRGDRIDRNEIDTAREAVDAPRDHFRVLVGT
jgi:hypothetical protein